MIPVEIVDLSEHLCSNQAQASLPACNSPYTLCYWAPADTHEGLVHYFPSRESNIGSREERTYAEGT